ncbi:MAG TPA: glycosyltransferase, partial [Steroidobacteraceae bacterium]|nr:glycosyltransferase [Steroidobacteraceae bacterium]
RLLSHVATRVLEAFPKSFPPSARAQAVGNPVRREIVRLASPEQRFAEHSGPLRLFVFGGSQGAARLNAVVPAALALLPAELRPQVLHQAGERHYQHTTDVYAQQGVTAQVRAFIDDMAQTYAWADLVICRAGALTVSELAAAGVGAVFVPFAAAVDDHQTRNAEFLVRADAGVLVPERDLTPQRLAQELESLFAGGRERLKQMAMNARAQAIVDADVRLADVCVAAAGGQA